LNAAVIALAAVAMVSCSNGPGEPSGGDPWTLPNSVIVNASPVGLDAPWSLERPDGQVTDGHGYFRLADAATGEYTLTWGLMGGWIRPSPATTTTTRAPGGSVVFSGTYVSNTGTPAGFVPVPAGTFTMGSPAFEPGRYSNENLHQVTLVHDFLVQDSEVTNQQYRDMAQWAYDQGLVVATSASLSDNQDGSTQELLDLDGDCRISFAGDTFSVDVGAGGHPVLEVTWYGAVAYCDWLSMRQDLQRAYSHATWQCNGGNPYTAVGYRLPTEAEWEFACRAGTQTPFSTGGCLDAGTEANYNGTAPHPGCLAGPYIGWTVDVRSYAANALGLYDMHGNLWEWCNDWYGEYGGPATDPGGPVVGDSRVFRGGAWDSGAQGCRSAVRLSDLPDRSYTGVGFRVVRTAP
jgi:formylglycine-generating enzyme required for sulfatase activity